MWDLRTIVRMNENAHEEYLKREGLTEEAWQQRVRKQATQKPLKGLRRVKR